MKQIIINKYKLGDIYLIGVKNIDDAMLVLKRRRSSLGMFTKLQKSDKTTIVETIEDIDNDGFTKLISAYQTLQYGNLSEAKELAEQLKLEYSENSEVYRLLSFIADYEHDYKLAMTYIDKAIECNNENTFAWLHKGRLFFDVLKKADDALSCFQKCVELDKYMFYAYHDLGLVCLNWLNSLIINQDEDYKKYAKEYAENAMKFFQLSKAINPLFLENYPNIAQIYLICGNDDDCMSFVEKSIDYFKEMNLYNINNDLIKSMKKTYEDAYMHKLKEKGGG